MAALNVSQQMKSILENYTDDVVEAVREVIIESANEARDELEKTSPRRRGKGGGKYAKSWSVNEFSGRTYQDVEVFNKKHYQLTHLLENGHAKRGGGRVEPIVHIATVNDSTQEKAVARVKEAIEKIK